MTNSWSRSRKLSMALRVIVGGMAATSCRIASFNCSVVPGRRAIASYVLFINKRIFCVPCFVWFLLTFKMWELFLMHRVWSVLYTVTWNVLYTEIWLHFISVTPLSQNNGALEMAVDVVCVFNQWELCNWSLSKNCFCCCCSVVNEKWHYSRLGYMSLKFLIILMP